LNELLAIQNKELKTDISELSKVIEDIGRNEEVIKKFRFIPRVLHWYKYYFIWIYNWDIQL